MTHSPLTRSGYPDLDSYLAACKRNTFCDVCSWAKDVHDTKRARRDRAMSGMYVEHSWQPHPEFAIAEEVERLRATTAAVRALHHPVRACYTEEHVHGCSGPLPCQEPYEICSSCCCDLVTTEQTEQCAGGDGHRAGTPICATVAALDGLPLPVRQYVT